MDDLLACGIGPALKVIHACYRYSRDKAKVEKNTLFKYVAPASASGENETVGQKQVIQELYWFYNYFTSCGSLYSGALLKQYTDMLQFIVEDVVKHSYASTEDEEHSPADFNPLLMTLANFIDHST